MIDAFQGFGFKKEDSTAYKESGVESLPLPTSIPQDPSSCYTEGEKALRDMFVAQYLVDYDAVRAAQRCGFAFQFAVEYARKFLDEPYVQIRIAEIRGRAVGNTEQTQEYNKQRTVERLMYEAHYNGPGSTAAARVAALKALSDIFAMTSSAQKTAASLNGSNGAGCAGGVMVVPAIADIDAWEAEAVKRQKALQDAVSEDQQ
jgi:Terminase small subunit.